MIFGLRMPEDNFSYRACRAEYCSDSLQLLFLASLALLVASLATIAVPKLVGTLIDTCISYTQGTRTRAEAMHGLNSKSLANHHAIQST